MNRIMQEYYPTFEMYQAVRNELMKVLTDDDLSFTPGGENRPLGELCREIGEIERAYIVSFKTFTIDFSYRNRTPGLANSVEQLREWFAELDGALKATVEGLSDEEVNNRLVDRGGDFKLPPMIQLDVYKEALLIFYGKANVYLLAMGKERPEQMRDWIG